MLAAQVLPLLSGLRMGRATAYLGARTTPRPGPVLALRRVLRRGVRKEGEQGAWHIDPWPVRQKTSTGSGRGVTSIHDESNMVPAARRNTSHRWERRGVVGRSVTMSAPPPAGGRRAVHPVVVGAAGRVKQGGHTQRMSVLPTTSSWTWGWRGPLWCISRGVLGLGKGFLGDHARNP